VEARLYGALSAVLTAARPPPREKWSLALAPRRRHRGVQGGRVLAPQERYKAGTIQSRSQRKFTLRWATRTRAWGTSRPRVARTLRAHACSAQTYFLGWSAAASLDGLQAATSWNARRCIAYVGNVAGSETRASPVTALPERPEATHLTLGNVFTPNHPRKQRQTIQGSMLVPLMLMRGTVRWVCCLRCLRQRTVRGANGRQP